VVARTTHVKVALIDESEIRREDGEILVAVGETLDRDRDANAIPEVREFGSGDD
jgi:hypothetical protein